jgi:hypothetical protein
MWRHQSPFLVGGTLCAAGHMATPEPSPGRWRALCLGARGGARALWHRERVWSREADLLSLVHMGTRSAGYQHIPLSTSVWGAEAQHRPKEQHHLVVPRLGGSDLSSRTTCQARRLSASGSYLPRYPDLPRHPTTLSCSDSGR